MERVSGNFCPCRPPAQTFEFCMSQPSRRSKRTRAGSISPTRALALLIQEATHCVFVTGAGISTNTDIRDYRAPNGIWTEAKAKGKKEGDVEWDPFYESIPKATPTFTHRAITSLVNDHGRVKFVISQNEDG